MVFGVDPCERRAEQHDLRGIVNPKEDDHDRTGCAIDRCDAGRCQVPADQVIAEQEQEAAGARSNPNVAPGDLGIGQNTVDQRDGQCEECPGDGERDDPPERGASGAGDEGTIWPSEERTAVTSSSASKSALIPRTARKDPNRSYRFPRSPRPDLGSTSQMAFSAVCSWLKSPVAPNPKKTMLKTVAGTLEPLRYVYCAVAWMAPATVWPTVLSISWVNRPCAASGPRTRLAAVKASTITGAMEKMA